MNDELSIAVRQAFEQEARSAPQPDDLLDRVLTGSRRRGIRNRVAGSLAAVAALAVAVAGVQVLPLGRATGPAGPADPGLADPAGPDRPAVSSGPGAFAAGEIELCLHLSGFRPEAVMLAWTEGGEHEVVAKTLDGSGSLGPVYTARAKAYAVEVSVLPIRNAGPGADPAEGADPGLGRSLGDARQVTVHGRPGVLGYDPDSGDRVLRFESGVREVAIQLAVEPGGPGPGDEQLLAWAAKFTTYADPAECAA